MACVSLLPGERAVRADCDNRGVIVLDNASVATDDVVLLAPTTLRVAAGEVVVLRGPNGAGKTTVLRLIGGQRRPTSGRVAVAGESPRPRHPRFRSRVATMIGLPPFARDLTLIEHAALIGVTWGADVDRARRSAAGVLSELGLEGLAERYPHELSSGQTQLAGLALTLVRPAEIVVLDEPEQRLDAERLERVLDLLRRRRDEGTTIVAATHSDRVVDALAARPVPLRAA